MANDWLLWLYSTKIVLQKGPEIQGFKISQNFIRDYGTSFSRLNENTSTCISLIICCKEASNLSSSPLIKRTIPLAPSMSSFKVFIISSMSSLSSLSESPKPGVSTTVNSGPVPNHFPVAYFVSLVHESWPSQMLNVQFLQLGSSPGWIMKISLLKKL